MISKTLCDNIPNSIIHVKEIDLTYLLIERFPKNPTPNQSQNPGKTLMSWTKPKVFYALNMERKEKEYLANDFPVSTPS
jgi:hypothetical protein